MSNKLYPKSSNELETLCSHTSDNELRGDGFVGTIASSIQNIIIQGIEALFLGFLLCPYGILMFGVSIIAFFHVANKGIKSI